MMWSETCRQLEEFSWFEFHPISKIDLDAGDLIMVSK